LCDWCEYWEHCPEKRHVVKIDQMKPAEARKEDGFRLVNEYAKLKEQEKSIQLKLDDLKERIISYAKTENITKVRGSGTVASVSTSTYLSLPSKSMDEYKYAEVVELVKKAGLWDEYSALDIKSLAGELVSGKLDAKLAKKLREYAEERKTETVRLTKVKEEEDD
jgi:hypothetical protein